MSMNAYDTMRQAMREANATMSAADSVANQMADMLIGRLRKCQSWYLKKLKKELSQYNAHTGKWKEDA